MDSELDSTSEELTEPVEAVPENVGDRLRSARKAKQLELSHIAAETRIPIRHLEAIENADFSSLPSRTYAIGFAKTYARSVGLDPVEIAQSVREELAVGNARASAVSGGMEPGDPAKLPSAGLAWAGGFAALALTIGVIAFVSTYFGAGADPESLITQEQTAASEVEAAAAAEAVNQAAGADAAVTGGQVVFTALQDGVWVRFFESGGERLFEGEMSSGDTFNVPEGASDPRINTGRPDLLSITIGGRAAAKLAEEPVTLGDAPVSAEALLARGDTATDAGSADN